MADPIDLASSVLTLATVAHKSCLTVYTTIQSFKNHPRRIRNLLEELSALLSVLESLSDTVRTHTSVDYPPLCLPLRRCSDACNEFLRELQKCCSRSGADRQNFRDWAKLRYMGDDIDDFKDSMASYKATINIALTDMQLRKSSVALERLEDFKDVIKTTTEDLEARLETIDKKLESLVEHTASSLATTVLQELNEERLSTQKYLLTWGQLSKVISQFQPSLAKSALQGSDVLDKIASSGMEQCRLSIEQTAARLENYMQDIFDQLMFNSRATSTQEDLRYLAGLRKEWETARISRDICLQANQQLREDMGAINHHAQGNKTLQLLLPDSQTLAHDKNRGHRNQGKGLGGFSSDQSIHRAVGDYLQLNLQVPRERVSPLHHSAPSIPDEARKFKVDSQVYNQLRTSSGNFVLRAGEQTDPGTRPTGIDKSTTTTTYRLLWTCSCGHQEYDDFIETVPGSVTRLAELLRANGVQSQLIIHPIDTEFFRLIDLYLMLRNLVVSLTKTTTTFFHDTLGLSAACPSTSIFTGVFGQAISDTSTQSGQQTGQSSSAVSAVGIQLCNTPKSTRNMVTQRQPPSAESPNDYMLLCSDETSWLTTRNDLNVSQIKSDRELFDSFQRVLRSRKCWARRFASLKTVRRISFVKFALRQNQEIDQLQFDQIPPPEETHYDYHERIPGCVPPIGNRYFMHRFSNSSHCQDSTFCLNQIPKRKHGRPHCGSAPDNFTAWGLYFHEAFDIFKLCFGGVVAVVVSLVFGITWAVGNKSLQDGFAVASYILALQVLIMAMVQVGIGMDYI